MFNDSQQSIVFNMEGSFIISRSMTIYLLYTIPVNTRQVAATWF